MKIEEHQRIVTLGNPLPERDMNGECFCTFETDSKGIHGYRERTGKWRRGVRLTVIDSLAEQD